jgi:hypothetical protein
MKYLVGFLSSLLFAGCAVTPPSPKQTLSADEIAYYKIDCRVAKVQEEYLERVIQERTYYTVDGVPYNDDPGRISKKFHAIAKVKLWTLRTTCKNS